jgi:hypothetical protein
VSALPYQPFYCEENVYRLCESERLAGIGKKVVFASNERRRIAMWQQKPAPDPAEASVWDYHVFLLALGEGGWEAWDPSSALGAPVLVERYLARTFDAGPVPRRLQPRFRVIDGEEFLSTFASDRSHMRASGGGYVEPPPPWPPVGRPGVSSNLARFVDMRETIAGAVMTLRGLRALLAKPRGHRRKGTPSASGRNGRPG